MDFAVLDAEVDVSERLNASERLGDPGHPDGGRWLGGPVARAPSCTNVALHSPFSRATVTHATATQFCALLDLRMASAISETRQPSWKFGDGCSPFAIALMKSWHSMIFVSP
jgi:hypothetical protein